jgi:hypothetical protein
MDLIRLNTILLAVIFANIGGCSFSISSPAATASELIYGHKGSNKTSILIEWMVNIGPRRRGLEYRSRRAASKAECGIL